MKVLNFFKIFDEQIVLALGFFDSLHKGHIQVINEAKKIAKEKKVLPVIFTFENNLPVKDIENKGLVFTFDERLEKIEKLGVNTVISTIFTKKFSNISPVEFIKIITNNFKVVDLVCGNDYHFGKGGTADVSFLLNECKKYGVNLHVVDLLRDSDTKISTTTIKSLLRDGKVEEANNLLSEPYTISGIVVKDRQVGRQMNFPTANVKISTDKYEIKHGVYKTHVILNGKKYDGITNYGNRPTFSLDEILTETYILGFDGDLYGKKITIYFDKFIRELVKFENIEELKEQIRKDLEKIYD